MVFVHFLKKIYSYLFERQSYGVVERERSSILWSIPQLATMAKAGTGRSQKPGTQPRSHTWLAGTQSFEPSLLCSRVHSSRKLKSRVLPGLECRHSKWCILTMTTSTCPVTDYFKERIKTLCPLGVSRNGRLSYVT